MAVDTWYGDMRVYGVGEGIEYTLLLHLELFRLHLVSEVTVVDMGFSTDTPEIQRALSWRGFRIEISLRETPSPGTIYGKEVHVSRKEVRRNRDVLHMREQSRFCVVEAIGEGEEGPSFALTGLLLFDTKYFRS